METIFNHDLNINRPSAHHIAGNHKEFCATRQSRRTLTHLEALESESIHILREVAKVQQPLVVESYASDRAVGSFIIIDEITNDSVAAGMIV